MKVLSNLHMAAVYHFKQLIIQCFFLKNLPLWRIIKAFRDFLHMRIKFHYLRLIIKNRKNNNQKIDNIFKTKLNRIWIWYCGILKLIQGSKNSVSTSRGHLGILEIELLFLIYFFKNIVCAVMLSHDLLNNYWYRTIN